jgi:hypothetical protein
MGYYQGLPWLQTVDRYRKNAREAPIYSLPAALMNGKYPHNPTDKQLIGTSLA